MSSVFITLIDKANSYDIIFAGCALVLLASGAVRVITRTKKDVLPLPPGPKPLPLIGNAFSLPMKEPWKTFEKWSVEFGEIVHVSVFNQSIIILNSPKSINDLMEKKSAIFSDRPRLPLVSELLDWNLTIMPYSDPWRKRRRVFSSRFGPGTVHMFNPAQDFASVTLLKRLLDDPEEFPDHLRLYMTQDIMMSTYGIIPNTSKDKFVILAERALNAFAQLSRPGAYLADAFPILKNIPSWVPGAFSQKLAGQLLSDVENMRVTPFLVSKELMSSGKLPLPCFVSDILENREKNGDEKLNSELEGLVSDCAMQAYAGGSDTCVSQLEGFFLAMTLNPAVQRKAQAEIDKAVGSSRLPSPEDRKNLPYVTAVMKEVIRWHVVAPHGLPHVLKEDDVYNGYLLPKGSLVMGSSWGILHNPRLYPGPMEFKPERFLDSDGQLDFSRNDPSKFAFGYGRRVCPGSYFAENALHLAISRILATIDIHPAKDRNGTPVPVTYQASTGIVSRLNPFKCAITPRSKEAAAIVQQANENILQLYKV